MTGTGAVLLVAIAAVARVAFAAAPVQNPASPALSATTEQASGSAGQDRCSTCHADIAQQFARNPHSRSAQQVHCSDCHQPHGSRPTKTSQSLVEQNDACTKCHGGLAGPFTWEHPPVKVEGCVSCHAPHGSKNAYFLTAASTPALCMQCHAVGKTSLHAHEISPAGLVRNRAGQDVPCTDCHRDMHGSNASQFFFKPKH